MSQALPAAVTVRDVTLRDGLQISEPIPTAAKAEILAAIVAAGVTEVEATAFVSPSRVPALADAAEFAAVLANYPQVSFSALVASANGVRRALAAAFGSVEYVVSASDAHSEANVGRSTAHACDLIAEVVELAHAAGAIVEVIVATAWDCPFDGPTPTGRALDVVARAVAAGADRVAIADTIGTATPVRVDRLIREAQAITGDRPLGAHFHNTRGTGLASAYAAVSAGVTRLDASMGGLGGCPFAPGASGNIAVEDLVYLLRDCGVETGIALDAAIDAGRVATSFVQAPVASALGRAGDRLLTPPGSVN